MEQMSQDTVSREVTWLGGTEPIPGTWLVLQGWTESGQIRCAFLRGQRQPGLFAVAVQRVRTSLYCPSNRVIFLRGW